MPSRKVKLARISPDPTAAPGKVRTAVGAGEERFESLIALGVIRFDTDNEGGYLDITTNDEDAGDYGMQFTDLSGGGIRIDASGSTLEERGATIGLDADTLVHLSADGVSASAPALELTWSEVGVRFLAAGEKFVIRNVANSPVFEVDEDGTITPAGIQFDTANSGGYLTVETTSQDAGSGSYAVTLHDTSGGSSGINLLSDQGSAIRLEATEGSVELVAGTDGATYGIDLHDLASILGIKLQADVGSVSVLGAAGVSLSAESTYLNISGASVANGIDALLEAAGHFSVFNSGTNPILSTDEATGVTTGHFDGGSP